MDDVGSVLVMNVYFTEFDLVCIDVVFLEKDVLSTSEKKLGYTPLALLRCSIVELISWN